MRLRRRGGGVACSSSTNVTGHKGDGDARIATVWAAGDSRNGHKDEAQRRRARRWKTAKPASRKWGWREEDDLGSERRRREGGV